MLKNCHTHFSSYNTPCWGVQFSVTTMAYEHKGIAFWLPSCTTTFKHALRGWKILNLSVLKNNLVDKSNISKETIARQKRNKNVKTSYFTMFRWKKHWGSGPHHIFRCRYHKLHWTFRSIFWVLGISLLVLKYTSNTFKLELYSLHLSLWIT